MIKNRLARERRKSEERMKDAIQEAEKLAKINKDQKSQYEIEKLLKENEELKAEKALSQMKNETRSMLNESGLENFDDQITNILVHTDAETTKKNVESFTNLLNQMVKSNDEKALRQEPPVSTQLNKMTKAEILAIARILIKLLNL
ncbi:phage capsid and scaffold protein [Staphylococcus epidermidis]|nr:phage capsid and scaffold protein [Staphylococcus epidermidis]